MKGRKARALHGGSCKQKISGGALTAAKELHKERNTFQLPRLLCSTIVREGEGSLPSIVKCGVGDIYPREAEGSRGAGEGLGSSGGRGRPILVQEGPDGPAGGGWETALGVVRSMGGARPPLGVLGRG